MFFDSCPHLQRPALEVSAVGTRNQLSVRIVPREPRFQVKFTRSCVVQSSRHDIHHSVRQIQLLVELLRYRDHLLLFSPTVFLFSLTIYLRRYHKLLDFLKLMHSEYSPVIFSGGSCFFSEASRASSKSHRHFFIFYPFFSVHAWDRLFTSSNQVVFIISWLASSYFV